MVDLEPILDRLAAIIADLNSIREQIPDELNRGAVDSQITAMSKLWRRIDDVRAAQDDPGIADAAATLDRLSADLKAEKQKLEEVAKVIHTAAQVIAVAEKVAKLAAA